MTYRKNLKKLLILIILLTSNDINSVELDGVINDAEWEDSKSVDVFYTVYPFSLNKPSLKTEARLISNEEGIFISFKNYQNIKKLRSIKSSRDILNESDTNVVVIDFGNNGVEAYEFALSSAGTQVDGTFTNGNDLNRDWDGDWSGLTTKGEDYWSSEFFIPWTVTTLPKNEGELRDIRIMFGRYIYEENIWISSIKSSYSRNKFLSRLSKVSVKNFSASKLSIFPYASSFNDSVMDSKTNRLGADIFWNTGTGRQINMTINPDFGQAESDDLVVNFSAQETFLSEKRAFFTENQSLFTIKDRDKFSVINTRRIGAAPDYDCSKFDDELACQASEKLYSDLDYAFRITEKRDDLDLGVFIAKESDETYSTGREFTAIRSRKNINNLTFGHVVTHVSNRLLNESSTVNAFDFDKIFTEKIRLTSTLLSSRTNESTGYGLKSSIRYRPNKDQSTNTTFRYFDKNLDLNDFGYLKDSDYFQLSSRSSKQQTNFGNDSSLNSSEVSVWWSISGDTNGNTNPVFINPQIEYFYKDGSKFNAFFTFKSSGKNTTITRKNPIYPFAKIKSSQSITLDYEGIISSSFEYDWRISFDKSPKYKTWGSNGYRKEFYKLGAKYSFDENLTFGINLIAKKEKEWLRWIEQNQLSSSDLGRREISFNLNWYRGLKHELRLKSQFIALKSKSPIGLSVNEQGYLSENGNGIDSFSIGQAALQLRYKYEFAPLSNIYLIYSKGGDVSLDNENNDFLNLFEDAWSNPTNEAISIKIRLKY